MLHLSLLQVWRDRSRCRALQQGE
uniref:Uncharacterized protein n=1 Tax=Anguilla anguilla TaxID=7936 RepID=A0A0E9S3V1_ANGAN